MSRRKNVDWDKQNLGDEPDGCIARRLGVTNNSVALARKMRGIPAFNQQRTFDWDSQPLGKYPDMVIAKNLGCSPSTVAAARYSRRIPAFDRTASQRSKQTHGSNNASDHIPTFEDFLHADYAG